MIHEMPCLIPTDSQNYPGGLNTGVAQNINGESFKQQSKPRIGLRPWQTYLPNAMLMAIYSGWSSMKKSLKLATVQMPPDSFFGMIMQGFSFLADRARPCHAFGMFSPNIHSLGDNIKFNPRNRPWLIEPQQMPI
jgi:hypothetical protein